MRGKDLPQFMTSFCSRITPAHAGKSGNLSVSAVARKDHPRTCGEKPAQHFLIHRRQGSPPHMRGKEIFFFLDPAAIGITPAHAGKSQHCFSGEIFFRDHPRTCGEKIPRTTPYREALGSPPHMRGKVPHPRIQQADARITPAHAGKSSLYWSMSSVFQDHPRTCGEKTAREIPHKQKMGSPLHMRGKEVDHRAFPTRLGITPAHAGKRTQSQTSQALGWDHPCTCGEKPNIKTTL